VTANADGVPGTAEQLRFLQSPAAHEGHAGRQPVVQTIETHMSWVFLVGDHVLKLKKPVRQPYLDFSTLARREFYCREELRLNSRLAAGVYLGLCVLHWDGRALALAVEAARPPAGQTLDWLVLMRRLPRQRMLDALIARDAVDPSEIDALAEVLIGFYRSLPSQELAAAAYLAHFAREQAVNREVLLRPAFALQAAGAALDRLDLALQRHAPLLRERAEQRCIVDGHGDLRPEHVCLLQPPVVIDALEFNAGLRRVDPLDEIACLGMECEAAGGAWIGPRLAARYLATREPQAPRELLALYAAYRALLRARLAAAHLLDARPRRPRHWLPVARRYVDLAARALDTLSATSMRETP
jgi:uncharacterized protein